MTDPVSLTLAIFPIVVEVFKTYKVVHGKIKDFRNCSGETRRLFGRFKCQKKMFRNECQLLFRIGISDEDIKGMLANKADSRWLDKDLEKKLKGRLSDSYNVCISAMEEIVLALKELEEILTPLDQIVLQRKKVSS
jgi:hypothetical protein